MSTFKLEDLDAALRLRFDMFLMMVHYTVNPGKPYLDNWHIDAMVFRANEIMRGNVKRLIVNVPPRNLKTLTFNVALSAFMLGHDPRLRTFCISYGERLAEDHAAIFRKVIESDWYQRIFFCHADSTSGGSRVLHHARRFPPLDFDLRRHHGHGR